MKKRVALVALAVLTAFAVFAFIAYGTLGPEARIRSIAIKGVAQETDTHPEEWIARETKHDGDQWEVQVMTQETNEAFYVTVSTSGNVLAIVSADERASDGSDVRP